MTGCLAAHRPRCWRCGTVAVLLLYTTERGTRPYCSHHFLRLGEIPPGSAARWVHDAPRRAN